MKILGIESSCDETAAAVVEDGAQVLSSVVASQLSVHAKYGGVVPELASREHLRGIVPVVRQALQDAGVELGEVAAIAVTSGPGLVGSLLVGVTYAKALAFSSGLPLIGVNHVEGHIYSVLMDAKAAKKPIGLPALALVVSGGHTHLYEVLAGGGYRLIGHTRDDAAGEAYDKVAKLLGLGYPGGPVIDRLAPFGNPHAVRFTLSRMKGNAMDFSFSGLKTAVLRWVQNSDLENEIAARRALLEKTPVPSVEQWIAVTPPKTLDLLASFQHTVIQELLSRVRLSADEIGASEVIIAGGVAANEGLRQAACLPHGSAYGLVFHFSQRSLSTDNAAMIAAAAYPKWQRGEFSGFDLKAQASLSLGGMARPEPAR